MATQHIQAERRDGVLKITLDRPDVLNSFNARMADELRGRAAGRRGRRRDPRRAAHGNRPRLLRGPGPGRSDARRRRRRSPTSARSWRDSTTRSCARSGRLEKPVVCAVNGVAAGAGANIAFACDIVLAAEGGDLHPVVLEDRPDPRFGRHLPPAAPRRTAARELARRCSARSWTRIGAKDWGLIYDVVPASALARHELRPRAPARGDADARARADQARIQRELRRTTSRRSSRSRRSCSARRAAPTTTRKACAPSSRSGSRGSRVAEVSNPPLIVGVVGAGAMGRGIAQVAAAAGHRVLLERRGCRASWTARATRSGPGSRATSRRDGSTSRARTPCSRASRASVRPPPAWSSSATAAS